MSALSEALAAAHEACAKGRRVVALVGWRIPREPILAAGFLPVQITPDLSAPTPQANDLLTSESAPETRALFEAVVDGRLDFAELIVMAPPYAGLSATLEDLRRLNLISPTTPPVYFFEALVQGGPETRDFAIARVHDLTRRIATLNGSQFPTADGLQSAIRATNAVRREIARVLALRTGPEPLTGSQVIGVVAAGGWLTPDAHLARLKALRPATQPGDARRRILIVSSSVLYDDRLHRLVEEAGGLVVGEDDIHGSCHASSEVREDGDPIGALGDFYQENQPVQRMAPEALRLAWFRQRSLQGDVDAVVFYAEEPSWGWDIPAMRRHLAQASIPDLLIARDVRSERGRAAALEALRGFLVRTPEEVA